MAKQKITSETVEELRGLVVDVVSRIVDTPDSVEVNVVPASYRLLAELHTHTKDVGQVVGRNGHVVSAIRSIIGAFAGKHGIRVDLDYVTEQENAAGRHTA